MSTRYSLSSSLLALLPEALARADIDPGPMLARYGYSLEQFAPPFQRLDLLAFVASLTDLVEHVGCLGLAARLGLTVPGASMAPYVELLTPEDDPARVVQRFGCVVSRLQDRSQLSVRHQGRDTLVVLTQDWGDRGSVRIPAQAGIGMLLRLLDYASAGSLQPKEIRFAHPAPSCKSRIEDCFEGIPVHHGGAETALVFEREAFALRLAWFRPGWRGASWTERSSQVLRQSLFGGCLGMPQVAAQLGLSERSLRRRLGEEGAEFRELLAGLRLQAGTDLLQHTGLPIHMLADYLGYRDHGSFTRAFVEHTGKPPLAYRKG